MRLLTVILLLGTLQGQAQWKSYILTPRHDTLDRVDLKGLKQGPWVIHVEPLRGEDGYDEQGIFIDDLREGVWKRFTPEGDLVAIENYRLGMKDGKSQYFLHTGELQREESWRAIDPKHPFDTVNVYDVNDPSKVLRKVVVKVDPNSYKNGTWTYYNTETGGIETTEVWIMNKKKEDELASTQTGNELAPIDPVYGKRADTKGDKKTVQKPKEVLDFEKKNAGKKKIKIRDGSTGG